MKKIPIYQLRRINHKPRSVDQLGFYGKPQSLRDSVQGLANSVLARDSINWEYNAEGQRLFRTHNATYVMTKHWLADAQSVDI